jgi:SAM-dependent methyltransferase
MDEIAARGRFGSAASVFEFGCGTGRFAAQLLRSRLPAGCCYVGVDVSPRMVLLSRAAVAPWRDRAQVELSDGSVSLDAADGRFDRFLSTYVLDLLAPDEIAGLLREAHRILRPGGLLALASLTPGTTPSGRILTALWRWLWRRDPRLVGGCRPMTLAAHLGPDRWRPVHDLAVTKWALSSEVVVAERL